MGAALTANELPTIVRALIEGAYGTIEGEVLESLCKNQKAFLSTFLDGILDGGSSEYRRGQDLTAKGRSLLERLRTLTSEHREVLVQAAASTQRICKERGISVVQAMYLEDPASPSSPAEEPPLAAIEPEQFGRCPCTNCSINIEFPIHGVGQTISCPKCGFEVTLVDNREQELAVNSSATEQESSSAAIKKALNVPRKKREVPEEYVLPYSELRNVSLLVLQEQGLVRNRIARRILQQLPSKPWETICDRYSDLLSAKGIHTGVKWERQVARQQEIAKMNLWSIAGGRGGDERPASDRQIDFLKSLGVRDEVLLSSLGVRQASKILDKLLEGREDRDY